MTQFPESSLVWARFDGIWYPAIVVDPGVVGVADVDTVTSRCVGFLPDDGVAVLPLEDLEAFSLDDEDKVNNPAVAAAVERAKELIFGASSEAAATAEETEEERKVRRKAAKQSKKDEKQAKKEAKKAAKAQRKAEKEERKKRQRDEDKKHKQDKDSSSDDDEDGDSDSASDTKNDEQRDDLDNYIAESGGAQRGALSRNAPRSSRTNMVVSHDSAGDTFLTASNAELTNELSQGRYWYNKQVDAARSEGRVLSMNEVEFLRVLERKLVQHSTYQQLLKTLSRRTVVSGDALDAANKKLSEIKSFDVDAFCNSLSLIVDKPPEKPERKKSKFSAVDPQLQCFLDSQEPLFRESVDPVIVEEAQSLRANLSKVGLKKHRVMKSWLQRREIAASTAAEFDLQPVATHGAVGRFFNEFSQANATKALNKASRSAALSRHFTVIGGGQPLLSANGRSQQSRQSIPSYFNFHSFHDYQSHASVLHQHDTWNYDAATQPEPLPLNFDPDAAFRVEEGLTQIADVVQAFELGRGHASAAVSSQRSVAMPSDQSMWLADSSMGRSVDDEAEDDVASEKATVATSHASRASQSARTSGEMTATGASKTSWRHSAKEVILRRVSLYVHGVGGKPKCVPSQVFTDIVRELLNRAVSRKSEKEKVSMHLKSREQMELTERESVAICESVDHYIERHYADRDDGGASRHRQTSVRSARSGQGVHGDPVYED